MRILGICAQPQRRRLHKVAGKLLGDGLIEEISAHGAPAVWRRDVDKGAVALRIPRRGLAAIGVAKDSALLEAEESSGAGQGADPARDKPARLRYENVALKQCS